MKEENYALGDSIFAQRSKSSGGIGILRKTPTLSTLAVKESTREIHNLQQGVSANHEIVDGKSDCDEYLWIPSQPIYRNHIRAWRQACRI